MRKKLTNTQIMYLKAIRKLQEENIYNDTITVKMIGEKMGTTRSTTCEVLQRIAEKGYLERTEQGIYIIKNIDLDKV